MDPEKIDWINNHLLELFDNKLNYMNDSYRRFKLLKKEIKSEYALLGEEIQKLIAEKNELENSLKNNLLNNSTITHSKSTVNTKAPQKPNEKKPDNPRSRTPNRADYSTNNTKPTQERSRTPMNEKSGMRLNRTEKNLINDLKNPRTPTRAKPEKPPERTPIKTNEKTKTLTPVNISKTSSSKSPLNDTKKTSDKKTVIKQSSDRVTKPQERDSKSSNKIPMTAKEKTPTNADKKDSLAKPPQDRKSKDLRRESSKIPSETKASKPKEELKEESKQDSEITNKEIEQSDKPPEEINKSKANEENKEETIKSVQEIKIRLNYPKCKPSDGLTLTSLERAVLLSSQLGTLDTKTKLRFSSLLKPISKILRNEVLSCLENSLSTQLKDVNSYLEGKETPEVEALLNKQFAPSKVAQSGLNFFNKDEENNLSKREDNPPEILNVFRFIFIMLNESLEGVAPPKYIDYLVTTVFPKYNIDSMKSLFIQHLAKNCNFTKSQILALQKMIEENPKMLVPNDLLKINKSVSYMAFMLKEIYEFSMSKTVDGTPIYLIKDAKARLTSLKEKLVKIPELRK